MKNKKKLSLNKQVVDNIQLSKVVGGSKNCATQTCSCTCGHYSCRCVTVTTIVTIGN